MSVKIRKLSRADSDFYQLLGPYFGSRSVAREIGINVYDDASKQWFAAFDDASLIGFASVKGSTVSDCYVVIRRRREGVLSSILSTVLLENRVGLIATCTPASLGVFLSLGFMTRSRTKNFTRVELICQRED